MYTNKTKGIICIAIGAILFVFGAAPFLLNLMSIFTGLFLVNYGLRISGCPPLLYTIQSWFDKIRF